MSKEITISASMKVLKGSLDLTRSINAKQIDMAGTHYSSVAQAIATSDTLVTIATDVATNGYTWLRNLDSSNYLTIGVKPSATYYPFVKLLPGEAALLRLGTATIYAKANVATVVLEVVVLEA